MSNSFYRPPDQLIKEWPEVFEDLYMNTMPVMYLQSIQLEFISGMVWEIDVKEQVKQGDPVTVADILTETLKNCRDQLERVTYQFDTKRFKKDIKKLTKTFF